jgi:hypothetical protein
MRRAHLFSLLTLVFAVPALAAAAFFALPYGKTASATASVESTEGPCFVAGNAGYRIFSGGRTGDHPHGRVAPRIVRVDNSAANPTLRLQLVDNAAAAEFVLVDDSGAATACNHVSTIESIQVNNTASRPDLTVAISRAPAEHKVYLHSNSFSETDAAALCAVIWQDADRTGSLRTATR